MTYKASLKYKNHPLTRSKNEIYYGSMSDPYVVFMQVLSTKNENDEEVPDKISVMLLKTDISLSPKDRLVKQSVKNGLFNSLDFAYSILERALSQNNTEK